MAAGPDLKAGPVRAPVIPLLLLGFGAYFTWFATHYWARDKGDLGIGSGTLWPSDPVKQALQGKGIPAARTSKLTADQQAVETSASQIAAATAELGAQQGVTPGTGPANPNVVGQAVASGAGAAGPAEVAFQKSMLADLGAPATTANLASLHSWFLHEEPGFPPPNAWNPLNIENIGGGFAQYSSSAAGAAATAAFITANGYNTIRLALMSGRGLCGFPGIASDLSRWSGGGYTSVC
jgi:hypothetical protein